MKQLDKKAVWLFFATFLMHAVFGTLLISFWSLTIIADIWDDTTLLPWENAFIYVIVIGVLAIGAAFLWSKLTYHYYRYELTDLGFRKESGVIWKKYITIPYARIQNVDINRGILARLLGLSDLLIQTAGVSATISQYNFSGIGSEGRLLGISKADAEVLRDELVRRANKPQGLGV